jgi:hypothetical protein
LKLPLHQELVSLHHIKKIIVSVGVTVVRPTATTVAAATAAATATTEDSLFSCISSSTLKYRNGRLCHKSLFVRVVTGPTENGYRIEKKLEYD